MPTTIVTGEAHIFISYRLNFEDGTRVSVAAVPLDPDTAREVLGNVNEDYTLIIPLLPHGFAYPALRGFKSAPAYVTTQTGLRGSLAELLAKLAPLLAELAPADDILDAGTEWYRTL